MAVRYGVRNPTWSIWYITPPWGSGKESQTWNCFLDVAGLLCTWTPSSCGGIHMTHTKSQSQNSSMDWGGAQEVPLPQPAGKALLKADYCGVGVRHNAREGGLCTSWWLIPMIYGKQWLDWNWERGVRDLGGPKGGDDKNVIYLYGVFKEWI